MKNEYIVLAHLPIDRKDIADRGMTEVEWTIYQDRERAEARAAQWRTLFRSVQIRTLAGDE